MHRSSPSISGASLTRLVASEAEAVAADSASSKQTASPAFDCRARVKQAGGAVTGCGSITADVRAMAAAAGAGAALLVTSRLSFLPSGLARASRTWTARKGGRSLRVKRDVLRSTDRHSRTPGINMIEFDDPTHLRTWSCWSEGVQVPPSPPPRAG
ncbi:hypothetical protein EYF80_003559 [Liparis tanakae]|uniref:Uncharacterized protein n=1 Tax=Liparis tanakae TaxID=230148 RepID=A0A4Z2J9P6_9TELE|nr:hypothetical protein EYF80_003559 [Liparis tanakae]